MKLARDLYLRWLHDPVGPAEQLRRESTFALREAHHDDVEFGYRLLADEAGQMGFPMTDRTARRLCNQSGTMSAIAKTRKRQEKKVGPALSDGFVQRDISSTAANQLWLADITEHRTREGKHYLCEVKEVFSRRTVEHSITDRMKARIAVDVFV